MTKFQSSKISLIFSKLSNRLIIFVSLGIIASTIILYMFISSSQRELTFDSFYTSTNGTLQAAKLGIELSHSEEQYEMMLQVFNWIKERDYFKFICLTEESDSKEEILIVFPEIEKTSLKLLNELAAAKSIDDSIYVLKTNWQSKNGSGNMYIGYSTAKLREYERQIIFDMSSFSLISVIFIILIVAVITASVTKPLKELKNVTDKIKKGSLDERANELKGGIEVTSVSKAFNQMVDELASTQKELSNEIYEAAIFVQSILPEPIFSGIRVEWRFLPSRDLGGDAFGYHFLDDDHLAVYLIDVSGHGVGPALLSVSVINILRNQSMIDTDFYNPGNVLYSLNNIFPMEKNGDKFFTAWYGVLNINSKELSYSSAGHPPAIIVKNKNGITAIEELDVRNNFIGFMENVDFESKKRLLENGDKLFIYSDGLYEIIKEDGQVLEKKYFHEILSKNSERIDDMMIELRKLDRENIFTDDCSLISITL